MIVYAFLAPVPASLRPIFGAAAMASAMVLAGIGPAAAGEFYLGIHGGASFTDDDQVHASTISYDTGHGYGFAGGYAFEAAPRLELELTRRENKESQPVSGLSNDRLVSVALLGNVYFDIDLESDWTPYVGLGTGLALFGGNGPSLPIARVAFQLGAGVSHPVSESLTASIDYRVLYADTGSGVLESSDGDYLNQSLWLGLRYGF